MTRPLVRIVRREAARLGMLRAGLTLGSLLERAAAVHGSSVMVDQAAEPRTGVPARILTVAAAAELVDVWPCVTTRLPTWFGTLTLRW